MLTENIKNIKKWLRCDYHFIVLLSIISLGLFFSIFSVGSIYVVALLMFYGSFVFSFEKIIAMFLFCYPFESVFYITSVSNNVYIFPIVYACMFFIVLVKYLTKVCKHKCTVNFKLIVIMGTFLLYLLLPINNKIQLYDIFKYVVALIYIYFLTLYKNKLFLNKLLVFACLGLVISIIFSMFVTAESRVYLLIGEFTSYGLLKKQGLFTNPNWLAVYSILLMTCSIYKFIFESNWYCGLFILIVFPYSYMTLSRDFIITTIITVIICCVYVIVRRYKKEILLVTVVILCILIVMICEFSATEVYFQRLGFSSYNNNLCVSELNDSFVTNENIQFEIARSKILNMRIVPNSINENNNWGDGLPKDPGRLYLWKRYFNDYKSSFLKVVFGTGVSAEPLGIDAHNSYIQLFWQYGLMGFILIYKVLIENIVIQLFREKSKSKWLLTIIVMFISFVESNLFNHVALIMLTFIYLSQEHKKNICFEKFLRSSHS